LPCLTTSKLSFLNYSHKTSFFGPNVT
jgi:hypothetical protein